MVSFNVDCLCESQDILGECPVWIRDRSLLYWIDISRPRLSWIDPKTRVPGSRPLGKLVGSIVERKAGGLLVAFRSRLALLDGHDDEVRFVELDADFGDERFNDGKCDGAGRFWVGTLDRNLRADGAALYSVDTALRCRRVDAPFTIANGIAWSPDYRTMYCTDTRSKTIYAYDFDLEQGTAENRRAFVVVPDDIPARPDGCAMDSEGCLWSAMVGAGCIRRFDQTGDLVDEISLPVRNPTSCCFGGPLLETLFITSARGISAPGTEVLPLEGGLFAVEPGVTGMAVAAFAG